MAYPDEHDLPTTWSEDGFFKVPHSKPFEQVEDANIAKRTRSKLCLSSTCLDEIEETFIPPDLTDAEGENHWMDNDWLDFLQKVIQPEDETIKSTEHEEEQEDEEQDPEYNILADEELDEIDDDDLKEELRIDKAVKITKKEFNNLMAELFEYTDEFCAQMGLNQVRVVHKLITVLIYIFASPKSCH